MAKNSDNYFVMITREDLPNLPYSVNEIYGIHASGKYHNTKRIYNEFYEIYSAESIETFITNTSKSDKYKPDKIIVEDSNSGYEFFYHICQRKGLACENSGGKSKIKDLLNKSNQENVLVIADGASIGPEMNELCQFMQTHPNTKCCLPESFEWLIDGNESYLHDKSKKAILNIIEGISLE